MSSEPVDVVSTAESAQIEPRNVLTPLSSGGVISTTQFCPADLVVERKAYREKVAKYGVVQRTHHDIDTHIPHPRAENGESINRGDGISRASFKRFLHDGIPPKDTVLVQWKPLTDDGTDSSNEQLVSVHRLYLCDRSFLLGDIVKRNTQSPMSGIVTDLYVRCDLLQYGSVDSKRNPQALTNISGAELMPAAKYRENVMIIYKGWVGRIETVQQDLAIQLSNRSVVVVPEGDDIFPLVPGPRYGAEVGELVRTKKSILRRGRWIFGSFNPNIEPAGQVVESRATAVIVCWLFQRPHGLRHRLPPQRLDVDVLESDEITVYDRSRGPNNSPLQCRDFLIGDWVRFKDIIGTAAKFNGGFKQLQRIDNAGYDLNTFLVISTRTQITVKWQDLTEESIPATSLIPNHMNDDVIDVLPGEIVTTSEEKPGSPPWAFDPAKVGIVQSVQPTDRTVKVRWYLGAIVRYCKIKEHDDKTVGDALLAADTKLGELSPAVEEISLYDVKPAFGLNKTRADFVALTANWIWKPKAIFSDENTVDWFGEVIDVKIDGKVIVRFGALPAGRVEDIELPHEALIVVYSSEIEHGLEMDYSSDGSDSEGLPEEDMRSFTPESPWMQGHPLALMVPPSPSVAPAEENDSGDGSWMTASESSDNEEPADVDKMDIDTPLTDAMTDVKTSLWDSPPKNNPQIDPQKHMELSLPEATIRHLYDTNHAPEPFSILDSPPPQTHAYASHQQPPPGNIRRIQKELRILQNSLPEGVFVRSWECRLDLLRVIIIGPIGTPYSLAPFIFDVHLSQDFPQKPPEVFFHSWTYGSGPINPNLYEDGKVCLSLLGTWAGESTESWSASNSTLLQVLVSILGLVLVKEPYYNEAGFEVRAGSKDYSVQSALYNERTLFRAMAFITHALRHPVPGFEDEIRWLYRSQDEGAPRLLQRAIDIGKGVMERSTAAGADIVGRDGIMVISAGAAVKLKQQLALLEEDLADS